MSDEYPQPGALLSLNDAKLERRCRICGEPIVVTAAPKGWQEQFREMCYPPPSVTLNFGEEFAHTQCLSDSEAQP